MIDADPTDPWFRKQDAATLRKAAWIMRQRSRKPKSFWLAVLTRVLEKFADEVEVRR